MDKDELWLYNYNLVKEYFEANGSLEMPVDYTVNGVNLDKWLSHQIKLYKKGDLSKEKVELLNDIDISLLIDNKLSVRWVRKYQLAKKYYDKNGNLQVPFDYIVGDVNLGNWLVEQRKYYNWGKLSKEKIDLLNNIGMTWILDDKLAIKWERKYQLAKEYYEKYGNLKVPFDYIIDGIKLGSWIVKQRRHYKNAKLSEEKVEMLNDIGMIWTFNDERLLNWERKYQLAKEYYEKNGDLNVPRSYAIDGVNLGTWIITQQKCYGEGKLSKEKIDMLNNIGMTWILDDKKTLNWERKYQLAKDYYEKNENLKVPRSYVIDGVNLGAWIFTQKDKYDQGKLTSYEIEKLEKIGIVWREQVLDKESKYDFEWLCVYKAVYEYFKNSESPFIPKNLKISVNGMDIYLKVWLDKQDKLSKLNSLSVDKEELFRNVTSSREPKQIHDLAWLKMFRLAIMYFENNGNIDIPFDYEVINEDNEEVKLGRWFARQKELYHCNRLSLEKINVLSKLGIDWKVNEKKLKYN